MTKLQLLALRRVKNLIESQSFPLPHISSYVPDTCKNKEEAKQEDKRNTESWKTSTMAGREAVDLLSAILEDETK